MYQICTKNLNVHIKIYINQNVKLWCTKDCYAGLCVFPKTKHVVLSMGKIRTDSKEYHNPYAQVPLKNRKEKRTEINFRIFYHFHPSHTISKYQH
jgi:hypothetical protein